jgi:hypothetical protein
MGYEITITIENLTVSQCSGIEYMIMTIYFCFEITYSLIINRITCRVYIQPIVKLGHCRDTNCRMSNWDIAEIQTVECQIGTLQRYKL